MQQRLKPSVVRPNTQLAALTTKLCKAKHQRKDTTSMWMNVKHELRTKPQFYVLRAALLPNNLIFKLSLLTADLVRLHLCGFGT